MGTYLATISPGEAHLMARIRAQDESAFGELFEAFRGKIYAIAFRILKEEQAAQDALQETFLNVYRKAHYFREDSKIGTWINRIAVNVCLEIIRKNKKHSRRTDEDISENTQLAADERRNPYHETRRSEISERVQKGLAALRSKHRFVVLRHDLEGYTIREIAEQLSVAEGTVKSRLFYGREALKRCIGSF